MKEERYFYVPQAGQRDTLPDDEAQHALKVLRLKEGAEIFLMDGEGTFFRAEVTLATNHVCQYHIIETLPQQRPWRGSITIAMAPTKMMERTEWFVEKATEIGVDEIAFLDCRFSERRQIKIPRIEKICIAAMKQSRKAWMPRITDMQDFDTFVKDAHHAHRYIAHCYDGERHHLFHQLASLPDAEKDRDVVVLIGPEGDFSIDEVKMAMQNEFIPVTLGNSRLRTETAALVATHIFSLVNGQRSTDNSKKSR